MNKPGITLFLILRDERIESSQRSYIEGIARQCTELFVFSAAGTDHSWIQKQASYQGQYNSKEGKVAALNKAVERVTSSHILLLESDEYCNWSGLPVPNQPDTCYRALIDVKMDGVQKQNYQVRLFPVKHQTEKLFEGLVFEDLSASFYHSNWKMGDDVLPIEKVNPVFDPESAAIEASGSSHDMQVFWKAILDSENQRYQQAEEGFRQFLKREGLFEFNYLAALNGLTNALVEQHKLQSAAEFAYRSLSCNSQQRAPYISLYKINKLLSNFEEAYQHLSNYLNNYQTESEATLDIFLPKAEAHFLMADLCFKRGGYQRAFHHYEQFYELNDGAVSQTVLEKLFIYAIELKNYNKAVQYFEDIFGSHIPDKLDEDMSARLLESLSLFMDNGWYDFVSQVYQELVTHNPEDNKLLNGWITTLIKNKEIDKAQELLASRKAS